MLGVRRLPALLAASLTAAMWLGATTPSHAGTNLLPNPGFEDSLAEPHPSLEGRLPRPVAPVGWVAEGAGGFSHEPTGGRGGGRHVAVVAEAGGATESTCAVACQPGLTELAKREAERAYTVNPHWRSVPVPVTGNATYSVSVWVSWQGVTPGAGVQTRVRWLDDFGVPIEADAGPGRAATSADAAALGWTQLSATVVAPPNAKSAVVLLGSRSDLGTGRLAFDDVSLTRT